MKLLHVIASPRGDDSTTLQVANAFLEGLQREGIKPEIDTIDLFLRDLPAVAGDNIESKYALVFGQPIDKNRKESWSQIERLIEAFLSADVYLISAPMWNFSIPYALKYYIDCIVQPGYLYKYNESGQPVGLVQDKRMLCITSRGGDYSKDSPFHAYDFQEPYLRAIFGFVGITNIHFINAQPVDMSLERRRMALEGAISEAHGLAASFHHTQEYAI